jgi:hypothetical protein
MDHRQLAASIFMPGKTGCGHVDRWAGKEKQQKALWDGHCNFAAIIGQKTMPTWNGISWTSTSGCTIRVLHSAVASPGILPPSPRTDLLEVSGDGPGLERLKERFCHRLASRNPTFFFAGSWDQSERQK